VAWDAPKTAAMDVSRKNPRILLRIEANAIMPAALNKYSFFILASIFMKGLDNS
jgi:hypothetical protein